MLFRSPYGEGHVDFEEVIGKAWEMGVRRFVAEFWYMGSPLWREDLADAGERMRHILDSLGAVSPLFSN